MITPYRSRHPLFRLASIATVVLLAACGSAPAASSVAAEPALAGLRLDYATYSPPSFVLKKQGWVEEAFKGSSIKCVYSAGSSNALNFLQGNAIDFGSTAGSAALLLAAWSRYRPTLVLVTHDLDEAVYLADRVILFSDRPARVVDVLRVASRRPRDRRDPNLLGLRVALLEALHLERSELSAVI